MMKHRPEKDFSAPECQPFHLEGGDHAVLLLHGFTGTAAHMRPLGELLHAQGFTVEGVNLPGHAQSMEAMAQTHWQDWLDAAKEAFCRLQARYQQVSVAGLSMGGCIALLIAEQMHPVSVITISAPMAVQNPFLPIARLAAPFVRQVMWRSREASPYQVDARYDYGYPGFYTTCGADLHKLIKMARRDLHAVQCPILTVQSRADEVISPDSCEIIAGGVSSDTVGTLWLEDAAHVCTLSDKLPRIAEAMGELLHRAERRN